MTDRIDEVGSQACPGCPGERFVEDAKQNFGCAHGNVVAVPIDFSAGDGGDQMVVAGDGETGAGDGVRKRWMVCCSEIGSRVDQWRQKLWSDADVFES